MCDGGLFSGTDSRCSTCLMSFPSVGVRDCWTNMRTRTKRTRGTENPDAFIRLNMRIVRVAHFSFLTQVERQLCIVNRGYAIVTEQE
jgi:hypothetical protein